MSELFYKQGKIFWVPLFILLLLTTFFFGRDYFVEALKNIQLNHQLEVQRTNSKIAGFLSLFVEKVLKSKREVSFEDRLLLENAMRSLQDSEIKDKWEQFVSSDTEPEIQQSVRELLAALANKITY